MKIVTKTGDKGETSLIGGQRVFKDDPHLEACGSIDELSAILGVCLSLDIPSPWREELEEIQRTLFLLAADLASPELSTNFHLNANHIKQLEDKLQPHLQALPEQNCFILNGGSQCGSFLHWARTVCRRAERKCVTLKRLTNSERSPFNDSLIIYINRLSDYLFAAARLINRQQGCEEKKV